MRQVVTPNLNVPTSIGMCLKYVQDAFGSGWAGSYALQGWNDIVQNKHADWYIPLDVYVPIWFDGEWNGEQLGHVAIYYNGQVFSSPYSDKTTYDKLGSINEVERIYGMKYIGWSEDIGGTIVITKEDAMNANDVGDLFQIARGQNPTPKELKEWVGKPMKELKDVLRSQSSWADSVKNQQVGAVARKDDWESQIMALRRENQALSKQGTTLKPGTYIVK